MILFLAALLPCLVWDQAPAEWKDLVCDTSRIEVAKTKKLPAPGVEYRVNEASASRAPWVIANGWRILRAGKGPYLYEVKGDAASLAAVEAFAYGADAVVKADEPGAKAFAETMAFLKQVKPADLPVRANIGVVDEGNTITSELMNLLGRQNLLFRIVSKPDPSLDLNVKIGSKEYPTEEAIDTNMLVHKIRGQLTDAKRLMRVYGSDVVVARLTGDDRRARIQLIDYAKRPVEGLRVRLLGKYLRHEQAISGVAAPKLEDYLIEDGATEFTIPSMTRFAVIDLYAR